MQPARRREPDPLRVLAGRRDPLALSGKRNYVLPVSKRVLIVDDSELAIQLLRAELEGKGFEILTAATAEEATSLVARAKTRPDLILLDINMPGVDGKQFCRFVKGNELFAHVKVVLCSGMDKESIRAVAEETGADGYVCKDEYLGSWVSDKLREND